MAVNIQVDEPDIDIAVTAYDGYVEATGASAPLAVGDAQTNKGDVVDAGPARTALVVGGAETTKGDGVDADGTSTALVTGDAQTTKGDGVAADGTSAQAVVGDAETDKGEATQGGGVNAPLAVGGVQMEGPWNPPWMPQDRPLSDFTAANLGYDIEPHFYLNFDEPHAVPKRLKDNWQRGTEATYWDGTQLQTAAPHEPRVQVDPQTGERYLLAEPQRTNFIDSRVVVSGSWNTGSISNYTTGLQGIDNTANATRLTDAQGNNRRVTYTYNFSNDKENGWTLSIFVKKDNNQNRNPGIFARLGGGTQINHEVNLDTKTGAVVNRPTSGGADKVEDFGDWWRVTITLNNNGSGNNSVHIQLIAARIYNGGEQSTIFDAPQLERHQAVDADSNDNANRTFGTSPIFTSGSAKTRAADDLSDLPFSMASGAKSVYFRIEQEAAGYGTNEGGNVTNAETNLTGTPGTAGGGMLRPSTGILGISASGWIDAVVNSTDEDLQGNSTSDVVDGLTIQPDKDPSTDGAIYRIHEIVAWEEERSYSERRSLTDERPQPWQELDPPNINTLDTLGGDIDWSNLGISEPPHLNIDIPRFGIPAKMRSAWERSTEATYWDEDGVLQTAPAGEPRVQHDPATGDVQGVLAEPQRTNHASTTLGDWSFALGPYQSKTGIGGNQTAEYVDGASYGRIRQEYSIPANNNAITFSIFIKKGSTSNTNFKFQMNLGSGSIVDRTNVDFSNAPLVSGYNTHLEIRDYGNGWWRAVQTINNEGYGRIRVQISNGSSLEFIGDAPQIEYHHSVATDSNGNADTNHATMPILTGGATRSNDWLAMPVWWEDPGTAWGGYAEGEQYWGGRYPQGATNVSYLNIAHKITNYTGLTNYTGGVTAQYGDGTDYVSGGEGDWLIAANNDDHLNGGNTIKRLWVSPDDKIHGVTLILRRMFVWNYRLTEGPSGQLKALFDHGFSV